ncbi:hypothetical protein OU994_15720 [Pseudoduganella sp. SL102]|uniref:hypothetical protein n=1 Tax=Pseudoduganella sp. SL102 TaxID=2995154 RepID=UPI00248C0889|nr:hypothetical protein [Pseudoduganella sp. SL102]WBS05631.1 hypothetical protein OU994_15720 [Pseudoduganella sp. SL102]
MRKRAAGKPVAPPPKEPARAALDLASLVHFSDPKAFLKAAMNERAAEIKQRVEDDRCDQNRRAQAGRGRDGENLFACLTPRHWIWTRQDTPLLSCTFLKVAIPCS